MFTRLLSKILKFQEDNPEVYAEIEWIYPEKEEEVEEAQKLKKKLKI